MDPLLLATPNKLKKNLYSTQRNDLYQQSSLLLLFQISSHRGSNQATGWFCHLSPCGAMQELQLPPNKETKGFVVMINGDGRWCLKQNMRDEGKSGDNPSAFGIWQGKKLGEKQKSHLFTGFYIYSYSYYRSITIHHSRWHLLLLPWLGVSQLQQN